MIILIIGYADFQNAGNIQPSTLMFAIAIIMSGLLLGRRAPFVAAFLIIVLHTVIVYFQMQGVIKLASAPAVGFENIVITSVMIFIIAFLYQFVISRLQSALNQAREDEKEVQISNRELEELSKSLEQRIADRTKELESVQAIMSKRAAELQTVAAISTTASRTTNVQEMLQTVSDLTKDSFDLYHAHIYLFNEDKTALLLSAGAGEVGKQMVSEKRSIPADHPNSLVARAARTAKGAVVNDVTQEPDFLPNPLLPNTRSEMAIPIVSANAVLGVLDVQGSVLNRFSDEDVAINTTLAQQVAASLENLRQYEETKSALSQSERLFNASENLARTTDLQELVAASVNALNIAVVNRALLTVFNYDLNGKLEGMTVVANWWNGTGQQVTAIGTHYPLEVIRVMPMFISPTPVFFDDVFTDKRIDAISMQLVQRLNLHASAVLPLHLGAGQIGALILVAEMPHHFIADETRLFAALAPQIATVMENRRQFERVQKQAKREAMLNQIGQQIQGAESVEAVLQIAARELGQAVGSKQTRVILKDYSSVKPNQK
jgi:GAF domain-containing protein